MNINIKTNLFKGIQKLWPSSTSPLDLNWFEAPKSKEHGHVALPVFRLSKELKKKPQDIAAHLAEEINKLNLDFLKSCEPLSGFVNFKFTNKYLVSELENLLSQDKIGFSSAGKGKKLIIDYSSPNVAKPMNVAHLRATMIGQAIRNLAVSQGYEVVGLNHLGDWGVQFGKLAWAYQQYHQEYDFENDAFMSLYKLYVRFHTEAEEKPELEELGAVTFKMLEDGDKDIKKLWKYFVDLSLKEYNHTWGRLGVKHDLVRGESFYTGERINKVVELLQQKDLLVESQGAEVVELGEDKPPCLIRKSDGATLYATRDLASALYRMEELGCHENLYVTGQEQKLHFKQVFQVLSKMGYDWAENCHHIAFGMYRFKNMGKMSSRKGRVIFLEDLLNEAVEMVSKKIKEKNTDLNEVKEIAEKVGVGAVIFNDLFNDRAKDIDFDWNKATDFEGDSGPYVQYSYVRGLSVLKKGEHKGGINFSSNYEWSQAESDLIVELLKISEIFENSFKIFKPHITAQYALNLAKAFSSFYNKVKVVEGDASAIETKLSLVESFTRVQAQVMSMLNMPIPNKM